MSDEIIEDGGQKDDLIACPECGGGMMEDVGDPSMVQCEKCGYRMTRDEANEATIGGEE